MKHPTHLLLGIPVLALAVSCTAPTAEPDPSRYVADPVNERESDDTATEEPVTSGSVNSDNVQPHSIAPARSTPINGGHTAALESDQAADSSTMEVHVDADIADVWEYLKDRVVDDGTVESSTTTTVPAAAPAPTTTAPTPAPVTTLAPVATPAPSREVRIGCPSGETVTLEAPFSMIDVRERCGMSSAGSSSSATTTHLTCSDGATHTFDRSLTIDEPREICGETIPTLPPTTTTIPLPRLVDIEWLHADGSPAGGFCIIPPAETWRDRIPDRNWCPPPGPVWYRWTATYDNGETISGRTPELNPGDEWTNRPNDWNGLLTVAVNDSGATFSAGWD